MAMCWSRPGANHEGRVPGSESKREGYRARAERDRGAPLCDSFTRRGRGLGRTWTGFATLRLAVSRDWDCGRARMATKGTPADALTRQERRSRAGRLAPRRRGDHKQRKLEPQPSDLPTPHRAENEAC